MNNQLPADKFIKAAADLSGRDPGELDRQEAIHILQEYGRGPQGDLYRQLTDEAAGELLSDPQHAAEWQEFLESDETKLSDLFAITLQRDLSPIIREKAKRLRDDLPQDDPRQQELAQIIDYPALSPDAQAIFEDVQAATRAVREAILPTLDGVHDVLKSITIAAAGARGVADAIRPAIEGVQGIAAAAGGLSDTISKALGPAIDFSKLFENMAGLRDLTDALANSPAFLLYNEITDDLAPYIEAELKKPEYEGKTVEEIWDAAQEGDGGIFAENSPLMKLVNAARAAKRQQEAIAAQNAGRDQRRQLRENAIQSGAIMELRNGTLPAFSARDLWDAFAPGRISRMGKLAPDQINEETGRIEKIELETGDIVPLNAADISYKAFLLLNAILANSVENVREYFISDGSITFYVKGVLDMLDIDPRVRNDMQLDFNRKTAGVLYLEKQFEPLQSFIGTTPDGSRYSVFNYYGYNVESDTMTIRTPYLYQLWKATQDSYSIRQKAKELRIAEGKKPLKNDLKPLEVNTLFKGTAYKEDDAVLEIATYITNVLLNAGKGAHTTQIAFRTLINNCPRLREKLDEIGQRPKTEKLADGKKRNNTARYNVELRKIARAYTLIMNPEKCDALKYFEFKEFSPTREKGGCREFIPPTKSTLNEKIVIKWRRIDPETD